jgi:hypothetical protein
VLAAAGADHHDFSRGRAHDGACLAQRPIAVDAPLTAADDRDRIITADERR